MTKDFWQTHTPRDFQLVGILTSCCWMATFGRTNPRIRRKRRTDSAGSTVLWMSVRGNAALDILCVTRGGSATLGTSMNLLYESAETRIASTRFFWVGRVNELVAVVVHFHSAALTNHFVVIRCQISHPHLWTQSKETCSRPCRKVFAIQMSSFKNLSMRRM